MLNFVRKAFRKVFGIVFWVNIVLGAIIGRNVFYVFFYSWLNWKSRGTSYFFGMLLGIVIALIINIIGGGLIAAILNIDENLEQMKNKSGSSV
jgi:hypothetical protein